MDGTPGYSTSLVSASKAPDRATSSLDLDSTHVPISYCSKRKNSDVNGPVNLKDGSSLVLGLGLSSISGTTICSGKEMEEESSIDIGLSINLNRGENRSFNPNNVSKIKRPSLDLQLSLSTGPDESDLTNLTQGFVPYWNYLESPALPSIVQLVDEGSTSSRLKTGPLTPPNPSAPPLISNSSGEVHHHHHHHHKSNVKTCQFEGCTRGARGASGLCIAHGGGRRCQRAGCHKGAEGKTVFCKAHGGGRRCQHLGCTKSAEGRTDYCIGHGGGKRCSHEECTRAARGKSGLCIRHGGGKRCKVENCVKSAEGISGLCISHGGGRRCQYPDCTKGAQGSTMFCKAHGGGRRCTYLGCKKGAEGSTPFCKGHGGGKRCTSQGCTKSVHGGTLFCVGHGGGKRCIVPECTKSARGRTSYCVRHGGGKRCKFEGCTKSAQGSTDFCKSHGGGKRCQCVVPCEKFARGKSGLCMAHGALEHEKSIRDLHSNSSGTHINGLLEGGNNVSYPCGTTSIGLVGYGHQLIYPNVAQGGNFVIGNDCLDRLSLPEGRVHGGGLMAMLRGGANFENNQEIGGEVEPGKSCPLPHTWM